jgi:hypothetical protein
VVDEVGRAPPVLLQVNERADLEGVRRHGQRGRAHRARGPGRRRNMHRRQRSRRQRSRGGSRHSRCTMSVLPVHGDADRDRGQHQHRDTDVPVRDAEGEHDHEDNEAHAANAARRMRGLADGAVGPSRVGRNASPESSRKTMAKVEAHAPFWRSRLGLFARRPAGPTMGPCQNGLRPRPH